MGNNVQALKQRHVPMACFFGKGVLRRRGTNSFATKLPNSGHSNLNKAQFAPCPPSMQRVACIATIASAMSAATPFYIVPFSSTGASATADTSNTSCRSAYNKKLLYYDAKLGTTAAELRIPSDLTSHDIIESCLMSTISSQAVFIFEDFPLTHLEFHTRQLRCAHMLQATRACAAQTAPAQSVQHIFGIKPGLGGVALAAETSPVYT